MPQNLQAVLDEILYCNAADPNRETWNGRMVAKEWRYSKRMAEWLARLKPDASPLLTIAVYAQHLERWLRPRGAYPMSREGYKAWRQDCAQFHAERAGEIMAKHGFSGADCARVASLIRKENLKTDAEAQTLEDCAALVFLQDYFDAFAAEHADYSEEKMLKIIRRTWAKMSAAAHSEALGLPFSPTAKAWIEKALG